VGCMPESSSVISISAIISSRVEPWPSCFQLKEIRSRPIQYARPRAPDMADCLQCCLDAHCAQDNFRCFGFLLISGFSPKIRLRLQKIQDRPMEECLPHCVSEALRREVFRRLTGLAAIRNLQDQFFRDHPSLLRASLHLFLPALGGVSPHPPWPCFPSSKLESMTLESEYRLARIEDGCFAWR
jgi:hypothetical protein